MFDRTFDGLFDGTFDGTFDGAFDGTFDGTFDEVDGTDGSFGSGVVPLLCCDCLAKSLCTAAAVRVRVEPSW